jgi:hypothetical protein
MGPTIETVINQTRRRKHHVDPCVTSDVEFLECPSNEIKFQIDSFYLNNKNKIK